MEYRKKCNVCGKVFCYSDKDLKNNTLNSAMSAVSAIGSLASIFGGGTIFHTAHLNNQTNRYADKVIDVNKCPYCNSTNVSLITDEEWKKLQAGGSADGGAAVSGVAAIKASINAGATPESLLRRAALFLEDEDWDSANAYCDACLDKEPENAGAYLGKMLADLKVHSLKELADLPRPFDENPYYKKTVRFADEELKGILADILAGINEHIRTEKLDARYKEACKKAGSKKIADVKDAIGIFEELGDWRDAENKTAECEERIRALAAEAETERLAQEKKAEEARLQEEKKKKKYKKIILITMPIILGCLLFLVIWVAVIIPNQKVNLAIETMESDDFETGFEMLVSLDRKDIIYDNAYSKMEMGEYAKAAIIFGKLTGYKDAKEQSFMCWSKVTERLTISASGDSLAITENGNVLHRGSSDCDVSSWNDIVALASTGYHHLGLKSNGTVLALTHNLWTWGECKVSNWNNIVAISTGNYHSLGLKSDGTVVSTDIDTYQYNYGQSNTSEWNNIIAISAGVCHSLGLKEDGTVIATEFTGNNNDYHGECDVSDWRDIIAIAAGWGFSLGLKKDGTVIATKYTGDQKNYHGQCDVSSWRDIVAITTGFDYTLGLKSDGTVVATRYLGEDQFHYNDYDWNNWKDIIEISMKNDYALGLKKDGTVIASDYFDYQNNYKGECDVSDWKGIKLPVKEINGIS